NVYSALKNFETNDCIMEVQNYLNTKLIITFNKEKKHIKITGDKELILTTEEALVYLKSFFRR
ncbi:hypothetical protein, partial [Tenacibaculum finnmarkense]|uniref:hypothetical protein n=1 Tax=Tenacibaculum finnmarkense TaxID=2781243 RepID=UPI001E2AA125